jgi:hypothetical protein
MATKPYFTHGVNMSASDRDLVTSTTMYNGQLKRYFSSLDAEIFIAGERILDIVRLDFSYEEKKMPYYGFNSYWPSRIFVGQKIIQGTFAINFTEPGYIAKLLQKMGTSSAMQSNSELIGKACSIENSPLFGRAFDILVGYGGYNTNSHESFRNTHQILEGVYINGYSQILDTSGEPVMEVYSFMAKNLKIGGYEFDENQYKGNYADKENLEIEDAEFTEQEGIEIVEFRDSAEVTELKSRCDKNEKLLGIVVDVTHALHSQDSGSHIYVEFKNFFNGETSAYVSGNVTLLIDDNEVTLPETFSLVRKKGEIFGTVLDNEKTKLIKDKLDKKNATQRLVSCSIAGIVMNKDSKKPFDKRVHMRKGNY